MRKHVRAVVLTMICGPMALALAGLTIQDCATMRPPGELSPVGDTAFYARRVILAVEQLQSLAIEGEQAGAISTADARVIVEATAKAGRAGVSLADALGSGAEEATARDRALAIIESALTGAVLNLSPNTQVMVQPYVDAALVLLTAFRSR